MSGRQPPCNPNQSSTKSPSRYSVPPVPCSKPKKRPPWSRFNEPFKPIIPKSLQPPNDKSPCLPSDQETICFQPPPLPSRERKPHVQTSSNNQISSRYLPQRATSFAGSHTTPQKLSKDHEYSSEDYEDVSFGFQEQSQSLIRELQSPSLLKFVDQNQDKFPIAFEVVLGFASDDVAISEDEKFIAHFLKRTKMFTIEDGNRQYTIPYNTSFQFAPLHDPNNNRKEALAGFVFKTAGDLMISRTLPKVIRARRAFRGVSPVACVVVNELLLVKEVTQIEGERRILRCISVSSGKEKQLHQECFGEFSTSPHEIKVYLPQILTHFQLPLVAQMSMGPENEEDIPAHLASCVVTISTPRIEESLIATSIDESSCGKDFIIPESIDSVTVNDIPLNFDINVKPITVTPLKAEKILNLADKLYGAFDPSTVYPYMSNCSSAQLSLIKSIRKEEDGLVGVTLVESEAFQKMRLRKQNPLDAHLDGDIMNRVEQLESQNEILKRMLEDKTGVSNSTDGGSSVSLQNVHQECTRLKIELDNLRETVSKLANHRK